MSKSLIEIYEEKRIITEEDINNADFEDLVKENEQKENILDLLFENFSDDTVKITKLIVERAISLCKDSPNIDLNPFDLFKIEDDIDTKLQKFLVKVRTYEECLELISLSYDATFKFYNEKQSYFKHHFFRVCIKLSGIKEANQQNKLKELIENANENFLFHLNNEGENLFHIFIRSANLEAVRVLKAKINDQEKIKIMLRQKDKDNRKPIDYAPDGFKNEINEEFSDVLKGLIDIYEEKGTITEEDINNNDLEYLAKQNSKNQNILDLLFENFNDDTLKLTKLILEKMKLLSIDNKNSSFNFEFFLRKDLSNTRLSEGLKNTRNYKECLELINLSNNFFAVSDIDAHSYFKGCFLLACCVLAELKDENQQNKLKELIGNTDKETLFHLNNIEGDLFNIFIENKNLDTLKILKAKISNKKKLRLMLERNASYILRLIDYSCNDFENEIKKEFADIFKGLVHLYEEKGTITEEDVNNADLDYLINQNSKGKNILDCLFENFNDNSLKLTRLILERAKLLSNEESHVNKREFDLFLSGNVSNIRLCKGLENTRTYEECLELINLSTNFSSISNTDSKVHFKRYFFLACSELAVFKDEDQQNKLKELIESADEESLFHLNIEDKNLFHIFIKSENLKAVRVLKAKINDQEKIKIMLEQNNSYLRSLINYSLNSFIKDIKKELPDVFKDEPIEVTQENSQQLQSSASLEPSALVNHAQVKQRSMGKIRRFAVNVLSPILIAVASSYIKIYSLFVSPILNIMDYYFNGKNLKANILNSIIEMASYVGIGMLFGAFGVSIGVGYLIALSASANVLVNIIDEKTFDVIEGYEFRNKLTKSPDVQNNNEVRI